MLFHRFAIYVNWLNMCQEGLISLPFLDAVFFTSTDTKTFPVAFEPGTPYSFSIEVKHGGVYCGEWLLHLLRAALSPRQAAHILTPCVRPQRTPLPHLHHIPDSGPFVSVPAPVFSESLSLCLYFWLPWRVWLCCSAGAEDSPQACDVEGKTAQSKAEICLDFAGSLDFTSPSLNT